MDHKISPQVAALVEQATTPVTDRGLLALLKPTAALTEAEMKDALMAAMDRKRGDPLRYALYDKVGGWHDLNYGTGPQTLDDTGKPVPAGPARTIPDTEAPLAAKGGESLTDALDRVAGHLRTAAETDGPKEAVAALQRGLNLLGPAAPIDEDGRFGPQTRFTLHHAVAMRGSSQVQNGLALGRFDRFARSTRASGDAGGLRDVVHGVFGPLYRQGEDGPRPEGTVLQETLNHLGRASGPGWTDLAIDGEIGPKTTGAFRTVLDRTGPEDLTRRLGAALGLL